MGKQVKHTPLPWRLEMSTKHHGLFSGPNGEPVGLESHEWINGSSKGPAFLCTAERADADAALVVQAVNNHEKLLEACRHALQTIMTHVGNGPVAEELRTQIAKATP